MWSSWSMDFCSCSIWSWKRYIHCLNSVLLMHLIEFFFFPTSKKNVKLLDDYISSWVIVAIFSSDCLIDMHGVGYMNYDHWVAFSLKDKCKCKCLGNCLLDLLLLNSLVWWQETLIISSPNVLYFINLI